jgi:hypothetical protein
MRALAALLASFAGAVCWAGSVDPASLQTPTEPTCVDVPEALSFITHNGLFNNVVTTRFERGPYISEKMDAKGTYYRGPDGGIRVASNEPITPGHGGTWTGGFYVPNNPSEPAKFYFYASPAKAPDEPPPVEATCATAGYVKDPATSKISFVALGTAGAIGGAAGGIAGRSVVKGGSMSYAQSAGVGAAGGLIAGVFIAWIVNRDAGKIYFPATPKPTPEFSDKLRALAATKVPLRELQPSEAPPNPPANPPATNQ